VVEPGGEPLESVETAEAWDSGRRPGPRLHFAGPQLDGQRRYYPFAVHAPDDRRRHGEIRRDAELGYSLVKTYTRLGIPAQLQAIRQAHALGLPASSHEIYPALARGGDRVEHLRGSSRLGYSSKQSDALRIYADVQQIVGATGATICPTIVVAGGFFDFWLQRPALATLPGYVDNYPATERVALAAFASQVGRQRDLLDYGLGNARRGLLALQRAGARVVAGTDSPIFPYGLALIAELSNYQAAGFRPVEALATATRDGAQAVGAGAHLGRIAPGYLADLVVVDGDPLEDINQLLNLRYTLRGGRVVHESSVIISPSR
jgi:hypothetical protein